MNQPSPIDWHARAAALRPRDGVFIDGAFRAAVSGATFEKISPVDGRVLARVAAADAADVDEAVRSARRAFEGGEWSRCAPRERKTVLLRFAQRSEEHTSELQSRENLVCRLLLEKKK